MISDIARFLLDPFHLFLLLFIAALAAIILKKENIAKYMSVSAFVWLLVITTPFVPYLVLNSLESKYDPIINVSDLYLEDNVQILVLAAGYSWNDRFPPNSQLDVVTLGRLIEGVRLQRKIPGSILITSGPYNHPKASQAEVAKQTAILMGVPELSIITQNVPASTSEEVGYFLNNHYSGGTIILVTSASHMHRAVNLFQNEGIEVFASPANFRFKGEEGMRVSIIPAFSHTYDLRLGLIEYAALFRDNMLKNR